MKICPSPPATGVAGHKYKVVIFGKKPKKGIEPLYHLHERRILTN
jgi:hypothetical protein